MAAASRRTQTIGGLAAVVLGLIIGAMVHLHPEGLRAPAWVAYVAASAFGFAGLSLLAGAFAAIRLQFYLGIAIPLSLFVIFLWIAIGPGERECSMTISFFRSGADDLVCRGAFGLGSALLALFLALVVRRATRPPGS